MIETIVVKFDEQYTLEVKNIRNDVFTNEQHIDEDIDFDGQDRDAVHVLVVCKGKSVGTGRMLKDGHIGRLAVLREYRGRGLGAKVVRALVKEAQNIGLKRVYLGAQKHAVGFYEKLDFSAYGEPFMESFQVEHIHMERFI